MNKLVGFTYNKGDKTSNYIYRRNLQGDIIGIYDSLGNEVGGYAYDAYGKCYVKYKDNSSEEEKTILNTNPFRYRGYYYDNETGLYYLNARYYDPSIGRFISPDVLTILDETKGQINGLNLYMYCNNNPIMYVDPSGCFPITSLLISLAIGFCVGALIGGGFEVWKQIHNNGWNPANWNWAQIGLSALGGGVAGIISAIPIPGTGFLSYLGTFFAGGFASIAGGLISGSVDSWQTALIAFGIGAIANVVGRGFSDIIKNIKLNKQVGLVHSNATRIANMSLKKKSLEIWSLIGSDNFSRNAFKSWNANDIFELLMTEATTQLKINETKNLLRYAVYSSIISSLISGWF